jgi:hypothetical protein
MSQYCSTMAEDRGAVNQNCVSRRSLSVVQVTYREAGYADREGIEDAIQAHHLESGPSAVGGSTLQASDAGAGERGLARSGNDLARGCLAASRPIAREPAAPTGRVLPDPNRRRPSTDAAHREPNGWLSATRRGPSSRAGPPAATEQRLRRQRVAPPRRSWCREPHRVRTRKSGLHERVGRVEVDGAQVPASASNVPGRAVDDRDAPGRLGSSTGRAPIAPFGASGICRRWRRLVGACVVEGPARSRIRAAIVAVCSADATQLLVLKPHDDRQ